jgi:hypothetical protein
MSSLAGHRSVLTGILNNCSPVFVSNFAMYVEFISEAEAHCKIFGPKIPSSCMQILNRWTSIVSTPVHIVYIAKLNIFRAEFCTKFLG